VAIRRTLEASPRGIRLTPEQVQIFGKSAKAKTSKKTAENENAAPEYDQGSVATTTNANICDRGNDAPEEKTEAEIQAEIQSIFRQITASVTFLPMLDGNCTFNVLVYADADSEVPLEWGDSDAKEIQNGEKVQLRSFSTSNHRVDTLVSYRYVASVRSNCPLTYTWI
jgi:mitotic spindle assembly checkpoint protein MAD2